MRLAPGARATVSQTTFFNNTVAATASGAVAAGPVMGLYAGLPDSRGSQSSAAWFHDCEFRDSTSSVSGEVAVENRDCHVFASRDAPGVWDVQLGREVRPWPLADVFTDTDAQLNFLRPSDSALQRIVQDESQSTGHDSVIDNDLPERTDFFTSDPYAGISDSEGFWTAKTYGLIVGIGSGAVLCALATLLTLWFWCLRESPVRHGGDGEDGKAAVGSLTAERSSIPSALAHNSHWATELETTFMGTMCDVNSTPPHPSAPTARKLEFLQAQLNSLVKDAVILERFTLLGPNQRRQGGVRSPPPLHLL